LVRERPSDSQTIYVITKNSPANCYDGCYNQTSRLPLFVSDNYIGKRKVLPRLAQRGRNVSIHVESKRRHLEAASERWKKIKTENLINKARLGDFAKRCCRFVGNFNQPTTNGLISTVTTEATKSHECVQPKRKKKLLPMVEQTSLALYHADGNLEGVPRRSFIHHRVDHEEHLV
jgi:hypothetical protein